MEILTGLLFLAAIAAVVWGAERALAAGLGRVMEPAITPDRFLTNAGVRSIEHAFTDAVTSGRWRRVRDDGLTTPVLTWRSTPGPKAPLDPEASDPLRVLQAEPGSSRHPCIVCHVRQTVDGAHDVLIGVHPDSPGLMDGAWRGTLGALVGIVAVRQRRKRFAERLRAKDPSVRTQA